MAAHYLHNYFSCFQFSLEMACVGHWQQAIIFPLKSSTSWKYGTHCGPEMEIPLISSVHFASDLQNLASHVQSLNVHDARFPASLTLTEGIWISLLVTDSQISQLAKM